MSVRLVVGPPGAGKSTYVAQHAKDGDLVIDLDAIRKASPNEATARRTRRALEGQAAEHDGDAWIIRTLADPARRQAFAAEHRVAETIVLATPEDLARTRARERDGNDVMDEPIARWWATYQPAPGETIIEPDTGTTQTPPDKDNTMPQSLQTPATEQKPQDAEQSTENANTEGNPGDGESNGSAGENGFPEGTPVKEMTIEQQAAYWRHKARKHEDAVKARADYDDLKKDAEAWREQQRAGMSEDEKRIEQIRAEAEAEAAKNFGAQIFALSFRALASDRQIPEQTRQGLLESIDPARFLTKDGAVDEAKLGNLLDTLKPAATPSQDPARHGGYRATKPATGKALGASLAETYFKKG